MRSSVLATIAGLVALLLLALPRGAYSQELNRIEPWYVELDRRLAQGREACVGRMTKRCRDAVVKCADWLGTSLRLEPSIDVLRALKFDTKGELNHVLELWAAGQKLNAWKENPDRKEPWLRCPAAPTLNMCSQIGAKAESEKHVDLADARTCLAWNIVDWRARQLLIAPDRKRESLTQPRVVSALDLSNSTWPTAPPVGAILQGSAVEDAERGVRESIRRWREVAASASACSDSVRGTVTAEEAAILCRPDEQGTTSTASTSVETNAIIASDAGVATTSVVSTTTTASAPVGRAELLTLVAQGASSTTTPADRAGTSAQPQPHERA